MTRCTYPILGRKGLTLHYGWRKSCPSALAVHASIKGNSSAQLGLDTEEKGPAVEAPVWEPQEPQIIGAGDAGTLSTVLEPVDTQQSPELQGATFAEGSGDPDNIQAAASEVKLGRSSGVTIKAKTTQECVVFWNSEFILHSWCLAVFCMFLDIPCVFRFPTGSWNQKCYIRHFCQGT